MDILLHTFSGMEIVKVAMQFCNRGLKENRLFFFHFRRIYFFIKSVVFLNIILSLIGSVLNVIIYKVCILSFCLGLSAYLYQMNTRQFNFHY